MLDFTAQKLLPPSTASPLMPRAEVLSGLDAAPAHRIVLLRAPAGYGKTSVMRLLHARLTPQGKRAVWLTLDKADRDPARLMLSLRAALLDGPAAPEQAEAPPLTTLNQSGVRHLFIDDLERLDDMAIRLLLSIIVDVLPPALRVCLGSRSLHQVSIANLKARQVLLELNLESLRFVQSETETYLRQANLFLAEHEIGWLQQTTEGWPAAVELLVLAWKRIQGGIARRLPDLHGMSDLSDYLAEEVLRSQPEDVQAFLLTTAPLQSFCVELANAVRGRDDSAALIERIRRSGLPIQPLGEHWFRYHPLFAGHIVRHRRMPRTARKDQACQDHETVYALAAAWLARNDRGLDAFDCYIKAGDHGRAADVLETLAETLRARAQFSSLLHCCDQLPESLLRMRPGLTRNMLVALVYSPRRAEARRWLEHFRQQADIEPSYGDTLRAFEPVLACLDGDVAGAIALAERHWPPRPASHPYEQAVLATVAAYSYLVRGSSQQAQQMLIAARRLTPQSGSVIGVAMAFFLQAYLDAMAGRLDAALQQMEGIDQLLPLHSATIPPAYLYSHSGGLLLMLLYERDLIEEIDARMAFVRGMGAIALPWDTLSAVQVIQARLMARHSHPLTAKRWLEAEIMKGRKHAPQQLRSALENELSRMAVVGGNRASIGAYAASLDCGVTEPPSSIFPSQEIDGAGIAQARLAIATGQIDIALAHLRALLRQAEGMGRRWRAAKLRMLLALALERDLQPAEALTQLALAVEQAAKSGLVRSLLDEGEPLLKLLRKLQAHAPRTLSVAASAHLDLLLRKADIASAHQHARVELTPAESTLLTLVAQGQSNRDVAARLGLSVNTVKWHMAQIFGKVGASNRLQAVNLAREAGLLGAAGAATRLPP